MKAEPELNQPEKEALPESKAPMPLPGVIAIGLYMLVLAAVLTLGVAGKHLPALLLVLVPLFIAASFGMIRMYRWAWALTLAAVFLLMSYNLWLLFTQKQPAAGVQGLLNLVFFFYLVRVEVRRRLR
jgi:hypothetical protein